MSDIYLHVLGFAACAGVIIFSGTRLSVYGDQIAELTGLGRAWVGLIIMASVTSLPELITGISSVVIVKVPDLAAGDIFGSCVFNLLILSVLDAKIKKPLFSVVQSSHIVAAVFVIILLAVAGIGVFTADQSPTIWWISGITFLIIAIYLFSVWGIFKYEHLQNHSDAAQSKPTEPQHANNDKGALKRVISLYIMHALIVIGAAIFLPYFGEHIAAASGLGNSFFGTLFMAGATSLPELVVSLAALRMGAIDMAVGNLLGSNVFNIFILALDDVFYTEGSLFKAISPSHLISVFVTIIMTAIVILGLLFKPKHKTVWHFSIDTFAIIILYILLMAYLFVNT